MPSVFVDSNVLVYSEDGREPEKKERALAWLEALWSHHVGHLSTQTLNEFYVNATRKLRPPLDRGEARAKIRRFQAWTPLVIDHSVIETAWAVEARYGLHFWDSLIVAAAQHLDCSVLLSEDLADGQMYGMVKVLDPFRHPPSVLDTLK
ncbi:PIN domain-containing protein [Ramlibacter albus]|uniref:Ribonuclease VapC n=1 Tax=Ramlibacter albus TaxID=2079448 RepID=A0A923S553_9BURK|nr:PIN domain-containing protein [Ramlibacter albus]MBC5764812.1 PIN domain-containing protein [Ramlibacter albus]